MTHHNKGEHSGEHLKGRMKEAVGDLTEDKGLQREGKVDQTSANIKDKVDDASDRMKEPVHKR